MFSDIFKFLGSASLLLSCGLMLLFVISLPLGFGYFHVDISQRSLERPNPFDNMPPVPPVVKNPPQNPPVNNEAEEENRIRVNNVIDFNALNNFGKDFWAVIASNKPQGKISGNEAHMLPDGLRSWTSLQEWRLPLVKFFRISFINLWGVEVISCDFRVSFAHGGNHQGRGSFLHGITVRVEELRVLWGFNFNLSAQVQNGFNLGTEWDPVAAAELVLSWDLTNPLVNLQGSSSFLVRGDGILQIL